jgi:hypothetical protein
MRDANERLRPMKNKAEGLRPTLITQLCLMCLLLWTTMLVASAQSPQPTPFVSETTWRAQPATPERMRQRIEESAVEYKSYAPIPRVVFYDIGFPHNAQEYAALDGYAVMLITALSQTREELPLKRVYVSLDGREINLKLLKSVLSEQKGADNQSVKTFGAYRADMLYLLPVYLRLKTAEAFVDFAQNRLAFRVAVFGTEVSEGVRSLPIKEPTGAGPAAGALEGFIKREFPGFFKE